MKEVAIQGAVVDYKPTKAGGGWIKIEMDSLQWALFREMFPADIDYFVAVARLNDGNERAA